MTAAAVTRTPPAHRTPERLVANIRGGAMTPSGVTFLVRATRRRLMRANDIVSVTTERPHPLGLVMSPTIERRQSDHKPPVFLPGEIDQAFADLDVVNRIADPVARQIVSARVVRKPGAMRSSISWETLADRFDITKDKVRRIEEQSLLAISLLFW